MITGRLIAAYRQVTSSYAYVPGLFLLGGVAAGIVLSTLDVRYGAGWVANLSFLPGATTSEGARSILTTVGGSMLSVAGIVFSITLAAIVFASGQYGPHVLPQYRRDRFSQATLGVMLSVFAYAMTVLYSVNGGENAVVPRLSILGALVLTGVGTIMLVMFIAHMLSLLHVSNIVARIGGHAVLHLKQELPLDGEHLPESGGIRLWQDDSDDAWLTSEGDLVITATGTGYVQTEATGQLIAAAAKHDLTIDILVRPGDYATPLTPIMRVAPSLPDGLSENDLRSAFAFGRRRTPDEDTAFLLDELCAIALRALSPGINDPFTATDVIHQLTAVTERAARGCHIAAIRRDENGVARVRRPVLGFDDVVRLGFDRIAADAATNVTVTPQLIGAYDSLISQLDEGEPLRRLRRSARRFAELCGENLPTAEGRSEAKRDLARTLDRSISRRGAGALRIAQLEREVAR